MGGNYEKGMYNQLIDVMAKLNAMELEHEKDRKEIKSLTAEVTSLRKENAALRETVDKLQTENAVLIEKCEKLEKENQLLRDDNERMKRILGNDSSNFSTPPSAEPPWKAPNTYNGRKTTKKKQGGQPDHKGGSLSKSDVEKKIADGDFVHKIEDIGDISNPYVTRYVPDLQIQAVTTEIRIHANEEDKYEIPENLRSSVIYGDTVNAICAYLYGEGVVSIDRIEDFINALSGNVLEISAGTVYHFCSRFASACSGLTGMLEQKLLNAHEIRTDATPVTNNGRMNYITRVCHLK